MNPTQCDLLALRDVLREFARARNWERYHTPKNLAMALIVEAAELVEHFQWATPQESCTLSSQDAEAVRDEVADVFLYLLRIADVLDIDLMAAAQEKIVKNAKKYPVHPISGTP